MTTPNSKDLVDRLRPLIERNKAGGWQAGPVRMPDGSQPPVPMKGTLPAAPAVEDPGSERPTGFFLVPWTEQMALRRVRVDDRLPREKQVAQLRDAIDDDVIPEDAVDALIDAGWWELDDAPAPEDPSR